MKPRTIASALLLAAAALTVLEAQRGERGRGPEVIADNSPYDGRWTFARIRFQMAGFGGFGGRGEPPWMHDYPASDQHLAKIVGELTTIPVRPEQHNVFTLDDPELFRFPFAYLCEPGFWVPNDAEAAGLRAYLQKGGFVIVDDFRGDRDWYNFESQMKKVLPEGRFVALTPEHPIFDSFYRIESLENFVPPYGGLQPMFYGLFENNDPARRLLMIVNFNNDIGDYWEWSDQGIYPIDLSNEAYKLGVNYLIYALSR